MNHKNKFILSIITLLFLTSYMYFNNFSETSTTPSSPLTGASTSSSTPPSSTTTTPFKTTIPSYIEDTGNLSLYFCPRENCEQAFLNTLNLAQSTLHCALYEINLPAVQQLLLNKSQTIEVQIVTDNDYLKKFNHSFVTADRSGLMHNKFCIIDNHITTTGSMNPTINDAHLNNNNLLIISSPRLSKNYEDEFQEMWHGIFKKGNLTKTPSLKIRNTLIKTYFCPDDNCAEKVRDELKQAKTEIYFMTFSFTNKEIANILLLKNLQNITIRGIMERTQIDKDSAYILLHNNSVPLLIDKNPHNMHHKVFIIDNTTVITGSFNPTKGGNERNDENIIILKDKTIAKLYLQEFDYLWNMWNNKTTTSKIDLELIEKETAETTENNSLENNTFEQKNEELNSTQTE